MRPYKVSTNFNISLVKGRSGQATVELVLLLVIVVALVAVFSTKIYKPFGNFTKSYMGEYLACLLDYGVLPKLGSEDDVCSESFKPINGMAGNNSNKNNASNDNNQNRQRDGSTLDKEKAQLRAARAGGGVSAGGINFPAGRRSQGSQATDAVAADDKKTEIQNTGTSKLTNSTNFSFNFGGQGKIIKTTDDTYLNPSDKEKIKKEKSKTNKVGIVESEESLGKQKRLLLKPPERKITSDEEDKPWTFGKLIRYLIITAILIAIVLFIVGQAVQISKSWEK